MKFSYVGLIKKNSDVTKALVMSDQGKYYVWTSAHEEIEALQDKGFGEINPLELELANQRQIEIGRGTLWTPNSSRVTVQVEFHGIISGGKYNKRILVKPIPTKVGDWHTVVVEADVANNAKVGDVFTVDSRGLSMARKDHISAGLGYGKLKRNRQFAGV